MKSIKCYVATGNIIAFLLFNIDIFLLSSNCEKVELCRDLWYSNTQKKTRSS